MKLVISLATRGRPQQLMETISRSMQNWSEPGTVMMVQLDADDAATIAHLNANAPHAWFVGPEGPRVLLNVQQREDTIAAKWNRALSLPADLYLVAADDDPYVTPGYDAKLLEAATRFPDGIGMVYGHMANASFSGVVAPTRKLAEKMGYIFPEYFPYWFVDHWTDDVARLIDRIAFADVTTDQSKAGRTQEMREPAWWATWFDAAYLMRRKTAASIIDGADFVESDWRKKILSEHAPLIEYRSRWINNNVRQMAPQLVAGAGHLSLKEERYQRVRQKAADMIPQLLDGMDPAEAARYRAALVSTSNVPALPQVNSYAA
jgi:hypothetical protein